MSTHTLNNVIRFILELAAIAVFGIWGHSLTESGLRLLPAILLPVGFAALWGIFAVRDDPSRSGKTVVPTPGIIRLMLELSLLGAAVWMLWDLAYSGWALVFGVVLVLHYAVSYDRILWLLKQK